MTLVKKQKYNVKVIFGNAVQDARGKLNGNVYSKNRAGSYVRTKVTPVNRRTSYQTAVRAAFTSNTKGWGNTLTNAQRLAWIDFASQNPFTNIFGEKRFLTGHQAYTQINGALMNIGASPISDPPTDTSTGTAGALTLAAAVAAGGSMTLTTNESGLPVGASINVYATNQLSPGINFVKSQLRYIGNFAAAGSPYNIKADWTAKYGVFPTVAGKKVFVAVQIINADGVLSTPSGTSTIIV